jgi:hypothetical protein
MAEAAAFQCLAPRRTKVPLAPNRLDRQSPFSPFFPPRVIDDIGNPSNIIDPAQTRPRMTAVAALQS